MISDYTPTGTAGNTVSGWTNDANLPHYAEGTLNGTEMYSYNGTSYTGAAACIQGGHTASQCDHYKIGNYYNWPAAIASNNASSITAQYTVAPDSICPAGWRLPKGLTSDGSTVTQSEFNALLTANSVSAGTDLVGDTNVGYTSTGFTKINSSPLFFVRSGNVVGTTLYYFTWGGYYWSGSAQSSSSAYNLDFGSSYLYPARVYSRGYGWSVRCVAR